MNKNKIIILTIIVLIIITGEFYLIIKGHQKGVVIPVENNIPIIQATTTKPITGTFDSKNSTFTIDGQTVTLKNGLLQIEAAHGSASKITTKYFGNESIGDLTGDGLADTAFLITQDTGGSGLFYYAVVAVKTSVGYKTTNAFLIGDRIAPQPTEINSSAKELYVNYVARKAGEPMTAQPSVASTLLLKVTPNGVLEGLMK